ncbi:MAG: FHA domain-containing protein [Anaerolineae bacterium]|nr:FHA domain-containing protein [Anaerolineae bacterium]
MGLDRKLLFHVRGHSEPLIVDLLDYMIVGRYDTENDEIPDIDLEPYDARDYGVSRRHASILVDDDAIKVMDLGSANSTHINGQKLIAHQARILRDGDELRLGRMVIRVNFA